MLLPLLLPPSPLPLLLPLLSLPWLLLQLVLLLCAAVRVSAVCVAGVTRMVRLLVVVCVALSLLPDGSDPGGNRSEIFTFT